MTDALKVIQLQAENFKRLKAIDITPDPDGAITIIGGRNAQGKSSVLDAIWMALDSRAASRATSTTRPIRDGEDTATVRVDLGDLIVTRTWKGAKSTLKVASKGGANYSSPQQMLDALIGGLSFDPLAFASLPAKDQQKELLKIVKLPFSPDEIAAERQGLYDERTEAGRIVKALEGQLAGIVVEDGTPDVEVSVADEVSRLREAQQQHDDANHAERHLRRCEQEAKAAEQALVEAVYALDGAKATVEALPDALPDLAHIEARIADAEKINQQVRIKKQHGEVKAALLDAKGQQAQYSEAITHLDQRKADGLAEAEFPVAGLGFDESGVTFHGVPFGQASAAERLRVSTSMAMALNPKLRVIRIADGSLLDEDNLTLIRELADTNDFQVWVERVGDADEQAIIIEDGEIA